LSGQPATLLQKQKKDIFEFLHYRLGCQGSHYLLSPFAFTPESAKSLFAFVLRSSSFLIWVFFEMGHNLVERLRVRAREHLAHALRTRLLTLEENPLKFRPELVHPAREFFLVALRLLAQGGQFAVVVCAHAVESGFGRCKEIADVWEVR
jgi:hypothetical protein